MVVLPTPARKAIFPTLILLVGGVLDASGRVVGTATHLVDNVKGGTTVSYAIQGTALQSNWSSVEVAVVKVSENINGMGGD